ncbi:MAG: hypothetical protein RMJ31_03000 [Nitrososphaerota archaeon]|nr:hypothetical protein [Nitrososphaerales archaeon]MCX8191625.1 hypothetical protein [Nitrososphaerales archaeon]MDW8044725.1 hypothetical protein [Nitrososphaerota archaeon]
MRNSIIYEERIISKWMIIILTVPIVLLLFVFYQLYREGVEIQQFFGYFLLIILILLGLVMNFSTLIVRFTTQSISVGYGILKYNIEWKDIEDCYLDKTPTIKYGGWGIRIGKVEGRWRLVFNVIGSPRIVLSLKRGRFKEFVFSTNDPQKVMGMVKQRLVK